MFGIGFSEMLIIGVIALIFIGPDQIPETARTIGKLLNELRRSTDTLKDHIAEAAKPINPMDAIIEETNKKYFKDDTEKYEHHQTEGSSVSRINQPETPKTDTSETGSEAPIKADKKEDRS